MRWESPRTAALGALLLAVGCGPDVGQAREAIINGTPDATHGAVVMVASRTGACTGTIIAVDGADGYVLTAARCVTSEDPMSVIQGRDYNSPDAVYSVSDFAVHPSYAGSADYDFAVVRFTGALTTTPVVSALTPALDRISTGTPVQFVGYGLTSYPAGSTSLRHGTMLSVSEVDALTFRVDTPTSGPCSGDTGGPGLVSVGGSEYVGGVISAGDSSCSSFSVSGRVSAVYEAWLAPLIGAPVTDTCGDCRATAAGMGGACSAPYRACDMDAVCRSFAGCINACDTESCRRSCATRSPAGVGPFNALMDCVCGACDGCACPPTGPDAGVPAPDGGPVSSDAAVPGADAGPAPGRNRGGCGCQVVGRSPDPLAAWGLSLLIACGWRVSRRRAPRG